MELRKCKICGKMFEPKSSRRSYCYEDHYHPCPICGCSVLTKDTYHLNECCCSDHSRQLASRTEHEKYSIWPSSTDSAKKRREATCLSRFGVLNPSYDSEIRKKISLNLHKALLEHPEYREKARQTYFNKTGYWHPMQNPEHVASVKKRIHDKYGVDNTFEVPEFKAKSEQSLFERYGVSNPLQNHDIFKKQRSKRSQYSAADGTKLDSTYEVAVFNFCLRNNIPIKRSHPLSYEYDGKIHKTYIDFVIDGMLVEVKGEHMLDGFYDNQPGQVPISRKLEIYRENNVIVITGSNKASMFTPSNGLKYLDRCPEPLIGIDIELFRNPEFPYQKNRPHCFYDVRVSGNKSSFEAFQDERLRWEMIKNRINYVGGFISSKDILTALNVTRKCKQPSWFSLSYAEYIIKKYCNSDTIVDPFAGWGTRHDAAVKLHHTYVGCDLNPELVAWHKEHNRSIDLNDACDFKYDGECDVFICPPYRDTEVYFDSQDVNRSQCEWLEVVRRNVPNARRYIMVCKIVDPGYEKFIVETKRNKSHFGVNNEYVIVIDNMDKK